MSETQTLTVADFLLARYAEDVSALHVPDWYCTDSARGEGWGNRGSECPLCERYMFDGTESATRDAWEEHYEDAHAKRRVLDEVEAKRAIVNEWQWWVRQAQEARARYRAAGLVEMLEEAQRLDTLASLLEKVTRHLTAPFADHPDYRPEWKP